MNGKLGPSINYSLTDMRVAKVLARPVIYPAIAGEILLAFQLISTTLKVFAIAKHLDLGFDAIWISPVVDNYDSGYHGYHARDMYGINSHFGTAA